MQYQKPMTAVQMNVALQREMSYIVADETLMARALKALRRLRRECKKEMADPTEMTEAEFLSNIEEAREEYNQGKFYEMQPGDSLDDFFKRIG